MTLARASSEPVGRAEGVVAPRRQRVPRASFWRDVVSPWPAVLVLAAGAMSTVVVGAVLTAWRDAETQRTADLVATGVRRVVEARVNDQLGALRQLAITWSRAAVPDGEGWKNDSNSFLQRNPGIALLAWMEAEKRDGEPVVDAARMVRSGDETHRLVVASASVRDRLESLSLPDELAAARATARTVRTPTLAGPFELPDGTPMCQVSVPLEAIPGRETLHDMLVALFEPSVLLCELLADIAPGYRIRITNERGTLYLQAPGGERSEAPLRWEVDGQPVRLESGSTWRLDLARAAGLQGSSAPAMETTIFVTGLTISVLLGVVVHLGQVARIRARALALTNRELQLRVREAISAHDRFRALNAELEARVADRTRDLDSVVSDLETFNYSISHDLRTPLGAITNFVELLKEDSGDALDSRGRDMLDRMARCAGMAVSMMDGLLACSRVGRQEIVLSRVDMQAQVRSAMAEVLAGRQGPPPDLVLGELPEVLADAAMMHVVWANLISNAVKATRRRENASIEVSARSSAEEDVFQVRDNGFGFEMRDADRLFRVFERLHADDRAAGPAGTQGHGVGLAVVQRIVTRHGGRVWAQSAPGKGATFYFSVPKIS